MSEIVILYILCRYDATIYKISKIIDEMFFAFLKSSLGTVNPAVKKLQNLGCIELHEKMSGGGMESKTCSITPMGRKHLKNLLLLLELNNPARILNNARVALFCSDVLDDSEREEFINNIKNHLILFSGRSKETLKNPYLNLNDTQKALVEAKIQEAQRILDTL